MANIKQQIKRIKTNEKSRVKNASFRSSMKTAIRQVEEAVQANDKAKAVEAYSNACKKLDKAQVKGIVHANFVARNKSKLALKVNTL